MNNDKKPKDKKKKDKKKRTPEGEASTDDDYA
jgi:hypothetical protein